MSLELEREDAVQRLCAAYARDHITTGELEARLERVYKSADRAQLMTVLEGLPAVKIARLGDAASTPAAAPSYTPAARPQPSAVSYDTPSSRGLPPGTKRYAAYFAEQRKEGAWNPAPRIEAKTFMGSILLDLREANIPAEGISIDADIFMGDLKVILPPGLGADVECGSFMGGVTDKSKPALPGAPVVRVTGDTIMGSITVVTKVPRKEGESGLRAQMQRWLGSGE